MLVEKGDTSTTVAEMARGGNDSHDGQGTGFEQGQGQRDDRGQQRGGGGECRGDAGNDLVGNTRNPQRRHFFARTAVDQRIAGLQANDALALTAEMNEQVVDLFL